MHLGISRLSSEIMELTTSPTVSAAFFFSAFWRFRMSHQSTRKMARESILMKQQTPTYLGKNIV